MTVMGALLALGLSDSIWTSQKITAAELQNIVTEHKDAKFAIHQYQTGYSPGSKWLMINLPEKGPHFCFEMPVDESVLAILKTNGIACPTYVQGRDFEVLGAPGRWIGVMAILVLAGGTVILVKRKKARQGEV